MEASVWLQTTVLAVEAGKALTVKQVHISKMVCVLWLLLPFLKAVCDPPCINNGVCSAPGTCECPEEWTGLFCQQGMVTKTVVEVKYTTCSICCLHFVAACKPPCLNGGSCITHGQCACPPGWDGNLCQYGEEKFVCNASPLPHKLCIRPFLYPCAYILRNIAVCNPSCQHGGICVEPNKCHCNSEWTGDNCEQGE